MVSQLIGDFVFGAAPSSHSGAREAPLAVEQGWFSSPRSAYTIKDDPIPFLREKQAQHGDTFRVKLGALPTSVVLNPDPAFLRRFFLSNESKLGLYKTLLARGILIPFAGERLPDRSTCKFVFYKAMPVLRRKLVPACGKRGLSDDFDAAFKRCLGELGEEGTFDSHHFVTRVVSRMTSQALFGTQFVEQEAQFVALVERLVALVAQSERASWPGWPAIVIKAAAIHREFKRMLQPIMEERRSWQRANPTAWLEEHNLHDLFSYLLDAFPGAADNLTEQQVETGIRMALVTGIYGAFANTVASIEGTLLSILADPNVCDEVEDDIADGYSALAAEGEPLARASLNQFPFVHACFKEFLRMNPATFLTRMVQTTSMELPGGFVAKPGTMVAVVPWITMRDPKRFSNPHAFQPCRVFEEEFQRAERDLGFLAFGQGMHKCKGASLANQQMKVIACALLREYKLELVDPFPGIPQPTASSVPSPNSSVRIRYARRELPLGSKLPVDLHLKLNVDFIAAPAAPCTPCSMAEESVGHA